MCIMSATCPTHLTLLYFISVIVFVEEYAIEFVLCPAAYAVSQCAYFLSLE
jgi:hypothetical protein